MKRSHKYGWAVIVPVVLVFAASLVGNAVAGQSSIEMKAGKLIPAGATEQTGVLVEFSHDDRFQLFKSYFGVAPKKKVCWVSRGMARRLDLLYRVRARTVEVRGKGKFELVTVFKGRAAHIRRVLGKSQARCTFVSTTQRTFFLPLDGHTS